MARKEISLTPAQKSVVRKMREGNELVGHPATHYWLKPYSGTTYYQRTINALEESGVIKQDGVNKYTLTTLGRTIEI